MLLRTAKSAVASAIGRAIDLDAVVRHSRARYVMAYHRVISRGEAERDHVHSAMWVSPETFESQLAWMRSIGEVVDYHRVLDFATPNTKPLFAITFDDGWLDTYEVAFPILKKHGLPAIVFLVSGAMESGKLFWPEDVVTKTHRIAAAGAAARCLAAITELWPANTPVTRRPRHQAGALAEAWVEALKLVPDPDRRQRIEDYYRRIGAEQPPLRGYIMSWDEAREMQVTGVSFGSHTHTHRILKGLPEMEIEAEVTRSRDIISDRLQTEVETFCYPNARYNGREGKVLARCGYRYAFRIDGRAVRSDTDPLYVPRFLVSEQAARNSDYFRLHLLEARLYAGRPHDPGSAD